MHVYLRKLFITVGTHDKLFRHHHRRHLFNWKNSHDGDASVIAMHRSLILDGCRLQTNDDAMPCYDGADAAPLMLLPAADADACRRCALFDDSRSIRHSSRVVARQKSVRPDAHTPVMCVVLQKHVLYGWQLHGSLRFRAHSYCESRVRYDFQPTIVGLKALLEALHRQINFICSFFLKVLTSRGS